VLSLSNLLTWSKSEPERESNCVDAARRGDRAAFDTVVAVYDRELRRFLSRKVAKSEVEDIAQETWVAAWNSLNWFDGRCRFRTWLFGIAVLKVKDHFRRKRSRPEPPLSLVDTIRYHEQRYGGAEMKESVRKVLETLSEAQREVIELYYFAELNLPEISRVLGRNLNTVKYQFYRAHAQAAEAMGNVSDWVSPDPRQTRKNGSLRGS